MGEIKQFASNSVPKPRYIFDNYKVDDDLFAREEDNSDSELSEKEVSEQEEDEDIFSFFSSHENIVLKPESSFKGLRSFLKTLPIDYYILL